MRKVKLHFSNGFHRGPGKVVKNLSKGLIDLGLLVPNINSLNDFVAEEKNAFHGFLQPPIIEQELLKLLKFGNITIKDYLFGPNIVNLPSEIPSLLYKYIRNMVVPSSWVYNLYRKFPILDSVNVDIWPVGIDTVVWNSDSFLCENHENHQIKNEKLKCFIYFKNRTQIDLKIVCKYLQKYNILTKIIVYGSYEENELFEACKWADFGILLTNTESQGIAYMQMLSTNLPLFVFNYPWWDYDGKFQCIEATSVPYFDSRCGMIVESFDKTKFEDFLDKVVKNEYSPRDYILENHTILKSAQKYYDILLKNSK